MSTAQTLKAVATGGQTAQEARNPYDHLKRQLENSKAEFLPLFGQSQQNVDRFVRVVLNAVLANPDLLEADRRSLIAACMKAAQDGLMPDGREAVLNIYNTNVAKKGQPDDWRKMAQYLPMVGGLVKKLYESGEVTYIDAACVYANDKFTYRRGDEPKLEHEPTMDDDAGLIVAAYAVIKLKNGEVKREVMPRRDIEAVRGASKSKNNGPWVTWYDQQAIKSVIKRAYKQLPKADAFERVVDYDNQALGFAATPQSVGDIVGRADALEHNPSDVIEHGALDQRHPEEVERQDAGEAGQQMAAQVQPDPAPIKVTYASLADRLQKCTDKEVALLLVDEARALPAKQRTELQALFDKQFPAE
jgi:recombination protein RecT